MNKAVYIHKYWQFGLAVFTSLSFGFYQPNSLTLFPPELTKGNWQQHIIFNSKEVFALAKYEIRFKINSQKCLDSLTFSVKTPIAFRDSVTKQLTRLNGQWTTNSANRWLLVNFYNFGVEDYSGRSGKVPISVHTDYQTLGSQLKSEEALFGPNKTTASGYKLTKVRYIRTKEGYLFRPIVSSTVI